MEIKDDYPEEYTFYERVKLYSVLAVPVKPRPCGFLAVRTPTSYADKAFADVLQLLAFVALVNIKDNMQRRMRKLVRSPQDIRSANDIYIKLFGDFEFITDKGPLTSEEARKHLVKKNMPKCLKNWQNSAQKYRKTGLVMIQDWLGQSDMGTTANIYSQRKRPGTLR